MFDLVNAMELTASAALLMATLAAAFGATPRETGAIAAGLAGWFAGVMWLGLSAFLGPEHGIGVAGLAIAVLLPVGVLVGVVLGTEAGRARLARVPLPLLVGLQTVRVAGVSFVLLYALGRLPAPFAPLAGWGDILVGALALPVAWAAAQAPTSARPLVIGWSILGLADLVAAVGLGTLSSPGPIQVFTAGPTSAVMTGLPWILIPCFLVPLLAATHVAIFAKLRWQAAAGWDSHKALEASA